MTDEKDLSAANKSVVDEVASEIERLDVAGDVAPKAANIPKPRNAKHGASKNDDANDPDYARGPEENERAWRKRRPRWSTKARGHVILFYNMDSRTQVERAFNGVVPTRVVRFASFGG